MIKFSERFPELGQLIVAMDTDGSHIYEGALGYYCGRTPQGNIDINPLPGLSASNYDGGALITVDVQPTYWIPIFPEAGRMMESEDAYSAVFDLCYQTRPTHSDYPLDRGNVQLARSEAGALTDWLIEVLNLRGNACTSSK